MRRLALVPAILVIALVTALPAGASPRKDSEGLRALMGDMPQSADWNDAERVGHREFDLDRENQCERGHHDHQRDSHARNLHRPGWQRLRV
jgi:hypothetical protein